MSAFALIDGDIIAYRAASGVQTSYDWGDTGGVAQVADVNQAVQNALSLTDEWVHKVKAKRVLVAFSGTQRFRPRILPTYKHHRVGQAKPITHARAIEAMCARFPHQIVDGLEGDDVLGILATTDRYRDDAVVVSIDKDMLTIPGRHFNPAKDRKVVTVSEREADYRWLTQTITGDATDGYTGIPGVGPKGALKILGGPAKPASLEFLWPQVVAAYVKAKLTEEDALTQARVARILRRSDYDKDTKEIILWHPTTPIRIPVVS